MGKRNIMTTKDKHLFLNDLCTETDGYLEQQIQTYKHLQDTLSVLEGIVDVLDVVTKKIN